MLAGEGVRLALVARRLHLLETLREEIVTMGAPQPLVLPVDLTVPGAPEHIFKRVEALFEGLDILVNNAGGSRPAPLGAAEEEWETAMTLAFTTVRRLTQLFLPVMLQRRWGRIINVLGSNEPTHLNADQVAKAAQQAWAKGLSREVGRYGVTVNAVIPGRIISEQIERMYPTAEVRADFAVDNIPVGYFGEPEDVGYMVAFLASSKARYVTGSLVYVDGGYHRFTF